ncbi:hypothetical protein E2A64_09220 [Pseudohoeflea suaedae]|uniref:Uncharacterized protein n=1 Tax=Pseudohoeflea suaedae TaxID=877384 RepID=A0A4R5PRL0_9HYPH|nr:hypothetical protein [Pseudohoeflea suaedae]TDH39227.1 hypothetical protein E2A64_09220 [Pseudohoeflea suaedae]
MPVHVPGNAGLQAAVGRGAAHEVLNSLFRDVYFGFGDGMSVDLGRVLPPPGRFRLGEYR